MNNINASQAKEKAPTSIKQLCELRQHEAYRPEQARPSPSTDAHAIGIDSAQAHWDHKAHHAQEHEQTGEREKCVPVPQHHSPPRIGGRRKLATAVTQLVGPPWCYYMYHQHVGYEPRTHRCPWRVVVHGHIRQAERGAEHEFINVVDTDHARHEA
jgi:hypothetical protein